MFNNRYVINKYMGYVLLQDNYYKGTITRILKVRLGTIIGYESQRFLCRNSVIITNLLGISNNRDKK